MTWVNYIHGEKEPEKTQLRTCAACAKGCRVSLAPFKAPESRIFSWKWRRLREHLSFCPSRLEGNPGENRSAEKAYAEKATEEKHARTFSDDREQLTCRGEYLAAYTVIVMWIQLISLKGLSHFSEFVAQLLESNLVRTTLAEISHV